MTLRDIGIKSSMLITVDLQHGQGHAVKVKVKVLYKCFSWYYVF